ncbi:MAG: hypothetical protein OHK0039_16040 [Bacteroidia bacterium]
MSISIKDIVSITGTPGLHRIIKTDDKSIVVESLEDRPKRQLVRGNMMLSKLTDISIYTTDESEPLVKVFQTMRNTHGDTLPVSKKSGKTELMDFMTAILPTVDAERVYPSNVAKLIGWYEILAAFAVDFTMDAAAEDQTEPAPGGDLADATQ